MLAGRSYVEVRRRMFPKGRVEATRAPDLRKHLKLYGCLVDARRLKPLPKHKRYTKLSCDAILKVWPRNDGSWHWVVWDSSKRRVLDPAEPPFVNYRVKGYLPVRRPGDL